MQKSAGSPRFSDARKQQEGRIAEHCRQREKATGGIHHHVEAGVVSICPPRVTGRQVVRHCACLPHLRRKWVEIIRANKTAAGFSIIVATATALVARIGELYAIERQLKESRADETTRQQVRAERSLPLFDQLMSELNTAALEENLLPGGALAKACRYALNLRAQLRHRLENGVTEIDNTPAAPAGNPA